MDLLKEIRKDGAARGGRSEFSWDTVKNDQHRENYLGHSVMAPVGRWQKGRDLNWYAKSDSIRATDQKTEEKEIKDEIKLIQEQEAAARAQMLGLAPPQIMPRTSPEIGSSPAKGDKRNPKRGSHRRRSRSRDRAYTRSRSPGHRRRRRDEHRSRSRDRHRHRRYRSRSESRSRNRQRYHGDNSKRERARSRSSSRGAEVPSQSRRRRSTE